MEFRTIVDIPVMGFELQPCETMLFVGSCFADAVGQRFRDWGFPVTVNPYGTMYNPASILHTIERMAADGAGLSAVSTTFLTLGTNHVYRLKTTGAIVDNCEKRPQSLFSEEQLSVADCAGYLQRAVTLLRQHNPAMRVVLTVSPIRYRKYGYHESQLSKAVLLLAADQLTGQPSAWHTENTSYFPAYEIVNDELRDYRFYAADMLHPSVQTVDYIWERLVGCCFSAAAQTYLDECRPLRQALAHRPFEPASPAYRQFLEATAQRLAAFRQKYPRTTLHAEPTAGTPA